MIKKTSITKGYIPLLELISLGKKSNFRQNYRSITIGNFDGCHLGHQALIRKSKEVSDIYGISASILTFNPTAKEYFSPSETRINLFTKPQKLRALKELAMSECIIQGFSEQFTSMPYQDFIKYYLKKDLRAHSIIVGENFRFGNKRLGTVDDLKQAFGEHFHKMDFIRDRNQTISSSSIRYLLNEGFVKLANNYLSRPYFIESKVIKGRQLGRTIGIPTANFAPLQQLVPKPGVYCGFTKIWEHGEEPPSVMQINKKVFPTVINIGKRPTISRQQEVPNIEAHIIDQHWESESLYEKNIGFYFIDRIRDERQFPSVSDLKQQINTDILQAKQMLENYYGY